MIEIKNVSFSYFKNNPVLKNVSFDIKEGECVILLGPNGVGKSTLISLILGINKLQEGQIELGGVPINKVSPKLKADCLAYIPQFIQGTDLTVFDTIVLGRLPYYKVYPNKHDKDLTNEYIAKFNLEALKDKQTNQISGGERQIVSIARGCIQESKTIIFDEPTSNLDISTQLKVLSLIEEEKQTKNKSFLISMHDINQALSIGDKFIFLKDGEIYQICSKEEVNKEIIDKVYNINSKIIDTEKGKVVIYEK